MLNKIESNKKTIILVLVIVCVALVAYFLLNPPMVNSGVKPSVPSPATAEFYEKTEVGFSDRYFSDDVFLSFSGIKNGAGSNAWETVGYIYDEYEVSECDPDGYIVVNLIYERNEKPYEVYLIPFVGIEPLNYIYKYMLGGTLSLVWQVNDVDAENFRILNEKLSLLCDFNLVENSEVQNIFTVDPISASGYEFLGITESEVVNENKEYDSYAIYMCSFSGENAKFYAVPVVKDETQPCIYEVFVENGTVQLSSEEVWKNNSVAE